MTVTYFDERSLPTRFRSEANREHPARAIWWNGHWVSGFENFNFFHLETLGILEKCLRVQSGVIVLPNAQLPVPLLFFSLHLPNDPCPKAWSEGGITTDYLVLPFDI
jgi:hypothetical protein